MQLLQATTPHEWDEARRLVREYAASLDVDLSFQNFAEELQHFTTEYAAPRGAFILAEEQGQYLACIGVRQFSADSGEIKRLYVIPAARGRGLGRMLVERIIAVAREIGYRSLLLDTLPFMKDAQALYSSFGFQPTTAYRFNPIEGSAFLRLDLEPVDPTVRHELPSAGPLALHSRCRPVTDEGISMKRREAIQLFTAAAAATLACGRTFAQNDKTSPKLRVLIFGGTGFLGPHFVRALQAGGHQVTLFNRGKSNPGLFKDLETLIGDRDGKLDALEGRDWDVVIDDSGYVPRQVKLSADLLKDRVRHYLFISSISVYGTFPKPGLDEDDKVAEPPDAKVEEVTNETYAGLKAGCEQVVESTYGPRSTIVRPHYVVGPGDSTDRFTYWVARVARGGQVLAPGSANDPLQYIDVRDLAAFVRRCAEQRPAGRFNACTPPGAHTMGELMESGKRVSGSNATSVWADVAFLDKNGVLEKGEMPIWLPPTGPLAGALLVNSARAVEQGLRFRDLDTTVRDTLDWHNKRPAAERQKLAVGPTPEREAELLKLLAAKKG